jgi:hypothetical protein
VPLRHTAISIRCPDSPVPGGARKHGKNSTITTSRALNKPPPMALKTCAVMTTTALRAERWVRATFPPVDVDAKAQAAAVSNYAGHAHR